MKGKCDHSSNTKHSLLITVELLAVLLQIMILGTTVVANFHDLLTLRKSYAEGSSFTSIVVSSRGKIQQAISHFLMNLRTVYEVKLKRIQ